MKVVERIPGGYYGNDAGFDSHDPGRGSVTVNSKRIDLALRWLLRRAVVLGITPGTVYAEDVDAGICIQYRLRAYDKAFEAMRNGIAA